MTRIVQFTDIHIGSDGVDTYGVDVRGNLRKVLTRIREISPDCVVLTGDLCYKEPKAEVYWWVKSQLQEFNIDPYIIPGNHDDNRMLGEIMGFELSEGELYYSRKIGDMPCLFLDSGPGTMSARQLAWLKEQLQGLEHVLIFIHHPPVACGVPYMDNNHTFRNGKEFMEVMATSDADINLYCGHYHVEREVEIDNLNISITPSTFFQIAPYSEDFAIDHYRVGYRIIELIEGGIRHWVEYI